MRTRVFTIVFTLGVVLLSALGCSKGSFSTFPIDMSGTVMSPQLFQIGIERVECAHEAVVGDTLHLRFWGLIGSDGCHEFAHFRTERDSFSVDVAVMGVVQPMTGCPEVIVMLGGQELSVHPLYEGDLTVVVHQPGGSVLVDTVHVTRSNGGEDE